MTNKTRLERVMNGLVKLWSILAILAFLLSVPGPAYAATLVVDSTGDGGDSNLGDGVCDDGTGACTLRAAIEEANALAGTDTINFSIGAGVQTISPSSALPIIIDPVIIDGTTQPGFTTTPIIELNGAGAGSVAGLDIRAGNSTVRGLVINRFGNFGEVRLTVIGGNVVQGNFIGTHVNGTTAPVNSTVGVIIFSSGNTIGGTTPGTRNVISGNFPDGIFIGTSDATGNMVQGNYIGTDVSGTYDLGNSQMGVFITAEASVNTIGGTTAGARNIISGNDVHGVHLFGSSVTGNMVQGNYIGTDVTGTIDLGNSISGVGIANSPNNTIGGTTSDSRNIISGNDQHGVSIEGSVCCTFATGNIVQGNYIGTDVSGVLAIGNSIHGVKISAASNNTIGGTASGEGNTIAFNGLDGVSISSLINSATGNTIRGNSIHSNGDKGIENINGGNTELPPPAVASAGSASGTACSNCTIDVYSDSDDEGRIYHGATFADSFGAWSFPGSVNGPNITATATDAAGNTSEFSTPFAFITPAVSDALEEAGLDPSSVPDEVLDTLTTADQGGILTVIEEGITLDENIILEPNGAVVLGEGSTLDGNIEGSASSTIVMGNDTTVEGNIGGVGLSFAGGSNVQINGNVGDDQSNTILVGEGADVLITGNLNAGSLVIGENGVVTIEKNLDLVISLQMAANASMNVGRSLTCDVGMTAIIAPSAIITVDRNIICNAL